jgi:hypothetical protein
LHVFVCHSAAPCLSFRSAAEESGWIQKPNATNYRNKIKEIVVVEPWESGKRSLFSIFSMAYFCYLHADLNDALLHLELESKLLLPLLLPDLRHPVPLCSSTLKLTLKLFA